MCRTDPATSHGKSYGAQKGPDGPLRETTVLH